MKNISRIIAAVLAILFVAALLPGRLAAPAAAVNGEQTNRMNAAQINRMNVMMVIDGSSSLVWEYGATDPNGYRYDAIDLFLALLTERGNHVSAIIFNGKKEFSLDTGFLALDGREDKLALSQQIREVQTDDGTNIGAALERGVEEAIAKSAENGLPSVVILFSDGRTDLAKESDYKDSIRRKENAVKNAQAAGLPIYTICLAVDDKADPDELREIAERTNGRFEKVVNAEALSLEFETFYEMIFGATGAQVQQATISSEGTLSFPVTIPTYGAEEVNVILDTRGLSSIAIVGPGVNYTNEQIEQLSMHGGYYQVIKLVDPPAGDWCVDLEGIPEKNVTVNVLFNINSVAALTTEDGRSEYDAGETVTFCANLVENGQTILEPKVTQEYTAELILNGEAPVPMTSDGQGTFKYTLKEKGYDTYTARVKLTCGNITLTSNEWVVTFGNTAPVAEMDNLTIEKMVWDPVFGCDETVEMSEYFTDAQDDVLKYEIVSSQLQDGTYDLDVNTGTLKVNTAECLSGNIVIRALDSQDAPATITVYFDIFDLTFWGWSGVVLTVLGVVVSAAVLFAASRMQSWKGDICVSDLRGVSATPRTNFRGSLKLKAFNLSGTGLNGKFRAGSHNQISFVSGKPVFTDHAGSSKQIYLRAGKTRIYADAQHTRGIEVEITPETTRGGGFGSGGTARRSGSGRSSVKNRPGSSF